LGAHPEVLEYFRNNFDTIRKQFRNEQAYLLTFYTAKASWHIGQRRGALASSTTAFQHGPPTIGMRHKFHKMHAL
jgi:hypothetical protein